MFLGKSNVKTCRKFTGEHPCRSVISIRLQSNFITPFSKNTCGRFLLSISIPSENVKKPTVSRGIKMKHMHKMGLIQRKFVLRRQTLSQNAISFQN